MDPDRWLKSLQYTPAQMAAARTVLEEVRRGQDVSRAIRRHPQEDGGYLAKHMLVAAYRRLVESGVWQPDDLLLARIRMKPVRTLSGVTTVTVLTKPYPCPGQCIFCPTDLAMPKSYLNDEPGAMRGVQNNFDPFEQVRSRIVSLKAVGHPTDKIELLILGGTWSAYPHDYQDWFIRRCFDAMNGSEAPTLEEAQTANEAALHRNVGLVIETRPDEITPAELVRLRRLGVTKVQMGAQSLDAAILQRNQRGHTPAGTLRAVSLLRAAGFKVVLHMMPNLLGATLQSDRVDFARLWSEGYCPDEIKIYPTQLLENTALYDFWKRGEYTPYSMDELIGLIADIKTTIPGYCRVNRVIRDIPSPHVVAGNRRSSLRQDALAELAHRGLSCGCIRCREVRGEAVDPARLRLEDLVYPAACSEEHFLSFRTEEGRIAGYLRLSLPGGSLPEGGEAATAGICRAAAEIPHHLPDLAGAALVREVHVYGQSLPVGGGQLGAAQHSGLGSALLEKAAGIARQKGFQRLAVIAAIGTRPYYEARGFVRRDLYLVRDLPAA